MYLQSAQGEVFALRTRMDGGSKNSYSCVCIFGEALALYAY